MTTALRIVIASYLLASGTAAAAEPARVTRVVHVSGDVTIEGSAGGRLAKSGSALAEGDSVTTAAGAVVVIELPDGSRLKLRESSRLAVTLQGPKSAVTEAALSFGSVFAKITKRLAGQPFQVRTPTAVAAVRGTEFFTAFGRAKGEGRDLWVCVNEGAVDLRTTKSDKGLLVPAGKGVLIKAGVDLTKPQAYDWTRTLNWNMDAGNGVLEDKTDLDGAYSDLLDQDYR